MENRVEEQKKEQKENKRGSRRRRGRRGNRNRKPQTPAVELLCGECGKPIKYVYTAIELGTNQTPVHFDCVIKILEEREELGQNEKICYIGQGSFGIIKYQNGSGGKKFTIRKRIAIEEQNKTAEWRKELGKAVRQ
jgi:hypothetical protein